MNPSLGMESLKQAGRTPLYTELTRIFSDFFELVKRKGDYSGKTLEVLFNKGSTASDIRRVIVKYTNLPIVYVGASDEIEPNMWLVFMNKDQYGDVNDFTAAAQFTNVSERSRGEMGILNPQTYDKIAKAANLVNDRDGRARSRIKLSGSIPYGFSIVVSTGFFYPQSQGLNIHDFTPDECAAFIIHEVGHALDMTARMGSLIFNLEETKDVVDLVVGNPSLDVVREVIDGLGALTQIPANLKSILTNLKAALPIIQENTPSYQEFCDQLHYLILAIGAYQSLNAFNELTDKDSDRLKTTLSKRTAERYADGFAVRNGATEAFMSCLSKLDQHHRPAVLKQMYEISTGSELSWAASFLSDWYGMFGLGADSLNSGYDPGMKRMEIGLAVAKSAFNEVDLPDEVKMDLDAQIQSAERYIELTRSAPYRKLRSVWIGFVNANIRLKRFVQGWFTSRLSGDYHSLQESLQSVSGNGLGYLAYRLGK